MSYIIYLYNVMLEFFDNIFSVFVAMFDFKSTSYINVDNPFLCEDIIMSDVM